MSSAGPGPEKAASAERLDRRFDVPPKPFWTWPRFLTVWALGLSLIMTGLYVGVSARQKARFLDWVRGRGGWVQSENRFQNQTWMPDWVQSRFDRPVGLSLGPVALEESDLVLVSSLEDLRWLTLKSHTLDLSSLRHLSRLKQLEALSLDIPNLDDSALPLLSELKTLTHLRLINPKTTPQGVEELCSKLPGISEPQKVLQFTYISDAAIPYLTGEELDLEAAQVTDEGMAWLKDRSDLRILKLGGTGVGDRGLEQLAGLENLEELDLRGLKLSSKSFERIGRFAKLRRLDLRFTKVRAEDLVSLAALEYLESLDLGGTGVDDEALESLAGFQALRELNLGITRVSDAGLETLARLPSLRRVNLSGTQVTEAGWQRLQQGSPGLQVIWQSKAGQAIRKTRDCLEAFAAMAAEYQKKNGNELRVDSMKGFIEETRGLDWSGEYYRKVSLDPLRDAWNRPLRYVHPDFHSAYPALLASGKAYFVSAGPDGKWGDVHAPAGSPEHEPSLDNLYSREPDAD